MTDVRYTEINTEEEGQRLDNYLIRILKGVPKSYIYRVIRGGEVRVNKKRAKPHMRLSAGDIIRIPPVRCAKDKAMSPGKHAAAQLTRAVIYEDEYFLVINKPSGIAVHGGSGVSLGVIEAFRKMRPDLAYLELAHRLDKETSGCLVLVKKRSILRMLQALFETRDVNKRYWTVLARRWEEKPVVEVNVPLKKNILQSGERMVKVDETGKSAQTSFHLMENYPQACWVEARPGTGRTHQIRVHSAHLGHAIIGDEKYGDGFQVQCLDSLKSRLYLHAYAIEFTLKGKQYMFKAELDNTFKAALAHLRLNGSIHE